MTEDPTPEFGDPFTSHLGYVSMRTAERTASSWIVLRDDLLDPAGRLHTGVLAYLVDSTAGVVCGMAARPSWVVTADLHVDVLRLPTKGPARADAVVRRPGRRQSCGEVVVRDEGDGDRVIAVGTVNHIVGPSDLVGDEVPTGMGVGVRVGPALPPYPTPVPKLTSLLRVERDSDGVVTMPITGVAVNPLGFLHGGLSGLLVSECAAIRDFDVASMMLRYLGPVREGSARAVSTVVEESDSEEPLMQVEISDDSGRPGAIATARLRRA
jgi:uncharacterized protein (TIGR00369 family)